MKDPTVGQTLQNQHRANQPEVFHIGDSDDGLPDAAEPASHSETGAVSKALTLVKTGIAVDPREMKQGDWICPNCADRQFSRHKNCRRCSTPKNMATQVQTQGGYVESETWQGVGRGQEADETWPDDRERHENDWRLGGGSSRLRRSRE